MRRECFFSAVSEDELNEVLEGKELVGEPLPNPWSWRSLEFHAAGVIWRRLEAISGTQPLVIIVRPDDMRRLYGRFAQLRSHLSPISAWCYVVTPQQFASLDDLVAIPDLGELAAAWTGLVISEAQLLTDRPLAGIKVPACLSTQAYAIARSAALWGNESAAEARARFDSAYKLVRAAGGDRNDSRAEKIRAALEPIVRTLLSLGPSRPLTYELRPVAEALQQLERARSSRYMKEAERFVQPLLGHAPEAIKLRSLSELAPEARLRLFDETIGALKESRQDPVRRVVLALIAGYIATVAAGGAPSLTLTENLRADWPEILAWAYVLGGIGEPIVWTSSFDGLGRLVARELMRPLRLYDPPTCDFSLDEAAVLFDAKLADPLVHLRVKQRLAAVALFPGVNVLLNSGEAGPDGQRSVHTRTHNERISEELRNGGNIAAMLAEALWPHLRKRIDTYLDDSQTGRKSKRKRSGQKSLPLNK